MRFAELLGNTLPFTPVFSLKGFLDEFDSSTVTTSSTSNWIGWAEITHMVVFGDSYSATGFNHGGPQPSRANPLGNPPYPGLTDTNGPNWVDFLTTSYNRTFLQTINLAVGGATVDSALAEPYSPHIPSFYDQVHNTFLVRYASHPSYFNWSSQSTLFATFFGINDVGGSYDHPNASKVVTDVIVEYASLLDTLYQHGARNFLILNVPPVNQSPITRAQGAAKVALEGQYIASYNSKLQHIASNLSRTYNDVNTFVFNTNKIFSQILEDPCTYPQTCPIQNTTKFCPEYMNGTNSWYSEDAKCGIPVDKYFWLNTLHPTFRVMNVTAKHIAGHLSLKKHS